VLTLSEKDSEGGPKRQTQGGEKKKYTHWNVFGGEGKKGYEVATGGQKNRAYGNELVVTDKRKEGGLQLGGTRYNRWFAALSPKPSRGAEIPRWTEGWPKRPRRRGEEKRPVIMVASISEGTQRFYWEGGGIRKT